LESDVGGTLLKRQRWQADGMQPSSVCSSEGLVKLVRLVQALIHRERFSSVLPDDDYSLYQIRTVKA
jgi:hypothetical protein